MIRDHTVAFATSHTPVPYEGALAFMEARVRAIHAGDAKELVWFLEHEPLYTAGTTANPADLIDAERFPVFKAGRGGQYTYHGPGQRIVYVMLNLSNRDKDVHKLVRNLEMWLSRTLSDLGVEGSSREGRVGVWVKRPEHKDIEREDKIAAIGVRLKRWVSFHGIALNVAPDLEHFTGITPCGIADPRYGVTSLADLGLAHDMARVDAALADAFEHVFESQLQPADVPF